MHNTSTKYNQMHNKTISCNDNWILIFICFEGRLLEPSASSSSSFIVASFLIQIIRWIRSSSRIEFFIFLIAWGIFFEWWELDLQLLPSSSSLLMSRLKVITSFWHTFLAWMNPMILGGHSRWLSPLLHSLLLLLPLQDVLRSGSSHSSTVLLRSYSDLCSSLQIAWSRNQTSSVSLGRHL